MAIIPLQTRMVYRIGKAYGYELDSWEPAVKAIWLPPSSNSKLASSRNLEQAWPPQKSAGHRCCRSATWHWRTGRRHRTRRWTGMAITRSTPRRSPRAGRCCRAGRGTAALVGRRCTRALRRGSKLRRLLARGEGVCRRAYVAAADSGEGWREVPLNAISRVAVKLHANRVNLTWRSACCAGSSATWSP